MRSDVIHGKSVSAAVISSTGVWERSILNFGMDRDYFALCSPKTNQQQTMDIEGFFHDY